MQLLLISLLDDSALGLRSIASNLDYHGIDFRMAFFHSFEVNNIVFPSDEEVEKFAEWIAELQPKFVGIAVRSPLFVIARDISVKLRQINPSIKIVWGGPHATIEKTECLEYADYVCVGEGEVSILKLMQTDLSHNELPEGIIDKNHPKTKIQVIPDLGILPPPLYNSPKAYYFRGTDAYQGDPYFPKGCESYIYELQATRGCPYHCSYCCSPMLSNKVRAFPVNHVVDEVVAIKQHYKLSSIFIIDEVFGINVRWLRQFAMAYQERANVPFVAQIHPNMVTTERVIPYKQAGMECAILGIQSGSQRIRRDVYCRSNTTNEELVQKINMLLDNGIAANIDMIIDNPYEKEMDIKDTFEFILSLPREVGIKVFSLVNLPKTALTERMLKDKIISEHDVEHYSVKSKKMWRGRLDKEDREAWRQYWTTLILLASLRNPSEEGGWDGVTSINSKIYHHLHKFSVEELRAIADDEAFKKNPAAFHEFAKQQLDNNMIKYLL